MTAEPAADAGALHVPIAATFASHGLWPLVLESLSGEGGRPWVSGELDPGGSTDPGAHDALGVLSDWWTQVIPAEDEEPEAHEALAPYGRTFPGLAPETDSPADPDALDVVVAQLTGRLGLVAVTRPADALAAIGWQGPVNHYSDMGRLSAVLRSWEDRFGAFLVGVGFDTITLAVMRPPATIDAATAIAAEHFAVCSDTVHQGAGSIAACADALLGQPVWTFWWD
jgi:hypothetical protein